MIKQPGATLEYRPPFPLVVRQDLTGQGVTFTIDAHGGWAERRKREPVQVCNSGGTYPHDCPNSWHWECEERVIAHYDDPIVELRMRLDLAPSSRSWIQGELAQVYPGAHIQERYPYIWLLFTGSTMRILLRHTYGPFDPGYRDIQVIVKTAGTPLNPPQVVSIPYRMPVFLEEGTIIR
ncbi:MAG: hypothetical protein QW687_00865 [Candidatus Hadarchaeales archaeon]